MAQRKPLQILIVGTAKEENKKTFVETLKESDYPTPMVYNISDTSEALKVLSDNTQDFDAVYLAYDSLDTFLAVDGFVSAAKSIRKKNGSLILADVSDDYALKDLNNAAFLKKMSELEIEYVFPGDPHAVKLRERKQQKEEMKEFADLVKESLMNAAEQLETEIQAMRASSCYRLAPNKDDTVNKLLRSLQIASNTFSLTMTNEEAQLFSKACSDFSGLSQVMYFNNDKQSGRFGLWLILAITVLLCVALFASTGAIGLVAAGIVALGALALMVASVLKLAGKSTESDVIKTSSKVASDIIVKNRLFDFAKDASGLLLFKPERKTEEVTFHNAVEATPELQVLLSS